MHTGARAMFGEDVAVISDKHLRPGNAILIPAEATAATLTFWHRFGFEHNAPTHYYDGGVFEVSTDEPEAWTDGASHIMSGGYNGVITPLTSGNPLGGRPGWVGDVGDWEQVTIDVLPFRSQRFTFRLRLGTDSSNIRPATGWWVDDIELSYTVPLTSCARAWSMVASYPIGIVDAAVVGHNGLLYVFGGETEGGETATSYAYSPQSDEWTPIAPLPEARKGAGVVSDGTYVYIFGGVIDDVLKTTTWRYDPAANNYTTLSPLGFGVTDFAAAFVGDAENGFILRIGGRIDVASQAATSTVEVYSIAAGAWREIAGGDHPQQLSSLAAVGIGRYVYTAGGTGPNGITAKTYRYDPLSNVWEDGQIADLPSPAFTDGFLYRDTWLLSANGEALGWDPATNRWRSFDQVPQLVYGSPAVAGDAYYLVGGVYRMAATDAVQRYVETDCASPTPTITPPVAATATSPVGPTSTVPPGPVCIGDCGGDRVIAIAELIRGVSIALGNQPLSACTSFDGNSDGRVAVNELIAAVNNALNGCA